MRKETTKRSGAADSGLTSKVAIVFLVLVATGAVLYAKQEQPAPDAARDDQFAPMTQVAIDPSGSTKKNLATATEQKTLPRLVDLGADSCIPCKMMAPILEGLRNDYAERFEVEFIDVWKNPDAGEKYGVQIIPTQIFYDAAGVERFRHQGFFSREDILTKWTELGLELGPVKEE